MMNITYVQSNILEFIKYIFVCKIKVLILHIVKLKFSFILRTCYCILCTDLVCLSCIKTPPQIKFITHVLRLVLSQYKKQVVFYHKKRVFYYKKHKNKKQPKILFFSFFWFFIFFHVQSNVLRCFLHSLWLTT